MVMIVDMGAAIRKAPKSTLGAFRVVEMRSLLGYAA